MAKSKTLSITVYAIVIIAAVVASVYVFSAFSLSSIVWLKSDVSYLAVVPHQSVTSNVRSNSIKPVWEVPPRGSKLPDLKTFRLTKELVEQRAIDNTMLVTIGNFAFMDFMLSWAKHLTDLGIHNFIVGAMDAHLVEALYWKGVPVFDIGSSMPSGAVAWGSRAFKHMGFLKAQVIDSFLTFGFEIIMCDADMVWLKNPLPYLALFPDADVLCSTDMYAPMVVDDSLDAWEPVSPPLINIQDACNIGMLHLRPTNSTKTLIKAWKKILIHDPNIWDQAGLRQLLQQKMGPIVDEYTGLFYAFDGHLKLGNLAASIFSGGHTFFVQAQHLQFRLEPYAAHATYQIGGYDGKRHRFRENMLFFDPPEYYDSPGGFLTIKLQIPKNLLYDGEHNLETHFDLLYFQIKKIRDAFAIASVLNRTLVMPPLWCRLDNLWYPHPGIMNGSFTPQPFLCPMDHVFEVHRMIGNLPENKYGPQLRFKEYSFFDNPSMPQEVKESWLAVRLCVQGSEDCQASHLTRGLFKFPNHSDDETFKSVFSAFKDVKVLQFLNMKDAFSGFTSKVRENKFRRRMKYYISSWCCLPNGGRVPIDIYWDEKHDWKAELPKQDTLN